MINKDYILRIVERFGRELSIILGLRQRHKHEEALIYIDDLLLSTTGLTSRFINSLSDDLLLKTLSPLGILNINSCLWISTLLKTEGEIYEELRQFNESYYRYTKALYLYLAIVEHEPGAMQAEIPQQIDDLLKKLEEYELPANTRIRLFRYHELMGHYAKAEDTLFELFAERPQDEELREQGISFYQRLQTKSVADLNAGNFSHDEVKEGLAKLQGSQS